MKWCGRCATDQPLALFGRWTHSPDGLYTYCKRCARGISAEQRAKRRANGKEQAYRAIRQPRQRARILKRKYGLGVTDYDALLAKQGGVCAICGTAARSRSKLGALIQLAVDHDHATGRVRGLLCTACNNSIGGFREQIELLHRAIAYLT